MQKTLEETVRIGSSLPRLLHSTGFIDIDLDAVCIHSDLVGIDAFIIQFNPKRFEPIYKNGILTKIDFEDIDTAFENLIKNPDSYIMMIFLIACGTKQKV
jgi:hypothetical protein